jgi:hypothetical protein
MKPWTPQQNFGMTSLPSLSDLLAIIHRDGGHYEAEHGTQRAFEDAVRIVHSYRIQIEEEASRSWFSRLFQRRRRQRTEADEVLGWMTMNDRIHDRISSPTHE